MAVLFCDLFAKTCWRRLFGAVKLLMTKQTASEELVKQRLAACQKCPVYYAKLRTCGSPLDKELEGLGCWCSVEAKSSILAATCWGDDHIENFQNGWNQAAKHGKV